MCALHRPTICLYVVRISYHVLFSFRLSSTPDMGRMIGLVCLFDDSMCFICMCMYAFSDSAAPLVST